MGNDEIGPEKQLGTIIMEFNSGSKELYNRRKVDLSNPSIKYGDTIFVTKQNAGPISSLEVLDMQFDLFLGAYKGSIKVEFDPFDNQVWFEQRSIRSVVDTGKIFVVFGCLSNATVANMEIQLLDISAPVDVHGVIAARNSVLDQPSCTSVLFWKSSVKKIEVGRNGVIPLLKSRVGVPLVSKFYVDVSLSINGEHYEGTVSFDPHTKGVYGEGVSIPGKEAKIKVKVKWDARKNSVFHTYDSVYRKWDDDEYDSEEDTEG
ncbi:hypothetical protein POM88_048267 [Heracleum sosnowskyi]|uniref:DUF6598 domain-containing protein n=1 Tax=Heracleum sosnowskyi TaxID=360622 RepID=A0AAD8GUW9_9APIA|nr:hypothetical protein POM88_048267 [Heracleum sosnowskyi]